MLKESLKITIGIGIIIIICLLVAVPMRLSAISQSIQEIRTSETATTDANFYTLVAGKNNIESIKETFWGDYIITYKATEKKDPVTGTIKNTSSYDAIIKSDYVCMIIYGQPIQEEDK